MEQIRVNVNIKISPLRIAVLSSAATAGVMGTVCIFKALNRAAGSEEVRSWAEATKTRAEQV